MKYYEKKTIRKKDEKIKALEREVDALSFKVQKSC